MALVVIAVVSLVMPAEAGIVCLYLDSFAIATCNETHGLAWRRSSSHGIGNAA